MKKQIFKLTSILLAMVMVFTLFTIIPISAEEQTASLSEAVATLKTAWKNLTYIGNDCTQAIPMNYFAGAWQGQADYAQSDDTVQGGTSYVLPFNATDKNLIYTAETKTGTATLPGTDIEINDVDSIYFYYKSDRDFTFGLEVNFTDSTAQVAKKYSERDTMSSSNGKWVPFDVTNYFNARNAAGEDAPSFAGLQSELGETRPYISRLTLSNLTAALDEGQESVNVSFSNLFVATDKNLIGSGELTDAEWFDKAAAIDPVALNAEYKDEIDSDAWNEFLAARDAVLACAAEAAESRLREAAEKMVTSETSYAYPIQRGRDGGTLVMTPNAEDKSVFGDYYYEGTLNNYGKPIDASVGGNGIWLQTSYMSGNDNLRFGDMGTNPYFTVEIISTGAAASGTLGFFGRMLVNDTRNDLTSSYTKTVVAGETYTIRLDDVLTGFGSDFADWENSTKSTGNIYGGLFIVGAVDADITMKIGSIVSTSNYTLSDDVVDLEGEDFVTAMVNLPIDNYGNTAAFEAALEIALDEFPEAAKLLAVKKLRAAASQMLTGFNSNTLFPGGYYTGSRNNFDTDVTNIEASDSAYETYGAAISPEHTLTAQTARSLKGIWMSGLAGSAQSAYTTSIDLNSATDESFFTVKVVNIKDETANPSINISLRYQLAGAANATNPTTYQATEENVVKDGEYKFYIKDILSAINYTIKDFQTTDKGGNGHEIHFVSVEAGGCDITVQVGSMVTPVHYVPIEANDDETFVYEMAKLKYSSFYSSFRKTEAFEEALAAALKFYPAIQVELNKEKVIEELRAAAKEMYAYGDSFFVPGKTYNNNLSSGTDLGNNRYSVNLESSTAPAYGNSTVDVTLEAKTSGSLEGLWFTTPESANTGSENDVYIGGDYDDATFTVEVNDVSEEGTYLTFYVRGNGIGYNAPSTYTKAIEKGGVYEISISEIFASTDLKNWQESSTAGYNGTKYTLTIISMAPVGGSADLTVGSIQYKTTPTISDATGIAFLREMYVLDTDKFVNTEAFNAKLKEAVELFGEDQLVSAKVAQNVINAASDLRTLGLKPDVYALREDTTRHNNIYGTSANGDSYITIDTNKLGNGSCQDVSGYVEYVPVTANGKLTLADLNDLSFAYKTSNVDSGTEISARVFITMEGDKLNAETNVYVGREHFARRNQTQSVVVLGDTAGEWQTFSFAKDLGDWRAWLLEAYTAGQNYDLPEGETAQTFTYEDVVITDIRLGFNQSMVADISLGSMYISSDNDYNINATCLEEANVLTQARDLDLTGVNKAEADEFKALVKELETAINEEAVNGYFVSGNYGAEPSLVDLSVLSRYVDGKLGDTFIDTDCADINGDGEINELDVAELREILLR